RFRRGHITPPPRPRHARQSRACSPNRRNGSRRTVGIRETLNQNPNVTTGLTAFIIIVAVAAIVWQISRGNSPAGGNGGERAFFTIDDGKSTFTDDVSKLPPFDYQGRPAYRAYVFVCKGGKIRFVGYLERYTKEAKAKI